MAKPRTKYVAYAGRTFSRPTMTYLKSDQRRAVESAAEAEGLAVGTWVRRLIIAELGRLAARDQLTA